MIAKICLARPCKKRAGGHLIRDPETDFVLSRFCPEHAREIVQAMEQADREAEEKKDDQGSAQ